ncbi:MAG: hypothetical protein HY899_02555 [Deltaproteobacteria bacterium]|nr:hypothetical protein [Deltaproteobacteria bacterium]
MSEFDAIGDFDGWKAKLAELLAACEAAAAQNDIGPRLAVSDRLTQFVLKSRPNTPEILALDDIANASRTALLFNTIDERLRSLSERSGELASLTKKLAVVTEAANAAASSVRLERANEVVATLTDAVRTLKDLRQSLDGGTDEELIASIEKLIASMQSVRETVEGVV